MCLILLAYDCHPRYKLVVAANRDEYYSRPTQSARFWPENPAILAGKDLIKDGTWTGITTTGRFAAVTVYREVSTYPAHLPSRGLLAANYLASHEAPEVYMERLVNESADYKGYSLLAGTFDALFYLSNRENKVRKLDKGLHGLSNNLLDVPWPKVTKGIKSLAVCLQEEEIEVEHLFAIMADRERPDDRDLPDTGVGLEMERMLGSACIVSPNYGTRATTIILVDRNNKVEFWERSLVSGASDPWQEVHYQAQVDS
ncbi:MAG: NRDE family protein [Firmicutes bacterium]|nr:NRDE family protein [Bacillota bacterium]